MVLQLNGMLGSMKAKGAGPVIVGAMRKGSLGAYYGLRALADLDDPATVPTVLEFLSDANSVVPCSRYHWLAPNATPHASSGKPSNRYTERAVKSWTK